MISASVFVPTISSAAAAIDGCSAAWVTATGMNWLSACGSTAGWDSTKLRASTTTTTGDSASRNEN